MNLIPLLSTIILIATIVTIIMAAGSFLVYKMREAKAPAPAMKTMERRFFVKYVHDGSSDQGGSRAPSGPRAQGVSHDHGASHDREGDA